LNDSNREDNINQFVRDFEEATKGLRDRFDRGQRISDNVQEVLNQASRIDSFIRRQRLSTSVEREWVSLRQDLNELARLSNVARRF
jgi:ABC-type transporter Mla subunit MlaD